MAQQYDLIIIGGGAAGLTGAIYMARARRRTLVIEQAQAGGQIAITADVVNYPGILSISGQVLSETMQQQAESFGAEFLHATVTSLTLQGDFKQVHTDQGTFEAISILLATGSVPRRAGFQGEQAFEGRGVGYCATCDGAFYKDKDVFVIGGGYAAAEEALFLTRYASSVTVCIRRDSFSCDASVADQVLSHPKIQVRFHTEIVEAGGDDVLRYAVLKNNQTGQTQRYEAGAGKTFGIFVFAGYAPQTQLFDEQLQLSEGGFLLTDSTRQTSISGVYGAGDVCEKQVRQLVTAAADGAIAAAALERYVSDFHEQHQLPPYPVRENQAQKNQDTAAQTALFPAPVRQQLTQMLSKFPRRLLLHITGDRSELSHEATAFAKALCALSDRLTMQTTNGDGEALPEIALQSDSGKPLGIVFHGVPGGHELSSFASLLYHAAGAGEPLPSDMTARLHGLGRIRLEIGVTLSCTMCPPTVAAAGLLTMHHPEMALHIYDVSRFDHFRQQYQIMSVPCVIVNGQIAGFGKMTTEQLLALLEKTAKSA